MGNGGVGVTKRKEGGQKGGIKGSKGVRVLGDHILEVEADNPKWHC